MYPPPTIRNRIYRIRRIVRTHGIQAALHFCLTRLNNRLNRHRRRQPDTPAGVPPNDADPFSEFSTPAADLRIRSPYVKGGLHYAPSPQDIFSQAIASLPIRFEDYVFIDLGSGKGQVLLLAAHYAFRRVIGVEYSETLTAIASANVRAATDLICQSVECICEDARDFALPHDRAVLYLYHPFEGKVMDKVVRNIEQSLVAAPRDLWIIYVNPMEDRKFLRSRHLKTVAENWDVPNLEFCIHRSIV